MTREFQVPVPVQENVARRDAARPSRGCGEGVGGGAICGATPTSPFPRGARCRQHRPDAVPATPTLPHPDPCVAAQVGLDSLGRPIRRLPTECKIAASIFVTDRGCWQNTVGVNNLGYAHFDGMLAHRFVYELLIAPVPDGLELDHLCRNRACCNPSHLEPVTHQENLQRGVAARLGGRCERGHDGPWMTRPDGRRDCRQCRWDTRPKQRVVPCTCANGRCAACRAQRRASHDDTVSSIDQRFDAFHAQNPHVYARLVELVADEVVRGASRIGVGALFERLRYAERTETNGDSYRLNNDYRALYVRLLLAEQPEWRDLFETRQRKSA